MHMYKKISSGRFKGVTLYLQQNRDDCALNLATRLKPAMELNDYPMLRRLDPRFLESVRLAYVYGPINYERVLMVTRDDDVYAFSTSTLDSGSPKKLDVLCKKGVKSFVWGMQDKVYIITYSGEVYFWEMRWNNMETRDPKLISESSNKILDITGTMEATYGLTNEGQVYRGRGDDRIYQLLEIPEEPVIEAIASGSAHVVAMTETGDLYGLGLNTYGQLGLGKKSGNSNNFVKISDLESVSIVKVACGFAHTLALARNGAIYAWGDNAWGQLGVGHEVDSYRPIKVPDSGMGKVSNVAASKANDLSLALGQDGIVYIWGRTSLRCVSIPTPTVFVNIVEAFDYYKRGSHMLEPMILQYEPLDRIKQSFDDPTTGDLSVYVGNKRIHLHKAILKIVSPNFERMLQEHYRAGKQQIVELDAVPYDVYRAYLKYLYTNEIDVSHENAIGLIDLAHSQYCDAPELTNRLSMLIKGVLTVENVNDFYGKSILYQDQNLKDVCNKFVVNNFTNYAMLDGLHDPTLRALAASSLDSDRRCIVQ